MGCEETAVVLGLQRHQIEMDKSCEFAKFHKVLASLVAITTAKDHDTAQDDYSRLLSGYSGAMLPPWLWLLSYNLHLKIWAKYSRW